MVNPCIYKTLTHEKSMNLGFCHGAYYSEANVLMAIMISDVQPFTKKKYYTDSTL